MSWCKNQVDIVFNFFWNMVFFADLFNHDNNSTNSNREGRELYIFTFYNWKGKFDNLQPLFTFIFDKNYYSLVILTKIAVFT